MLPVSGALQLHTSLAISERPMRSASGAYSTFASPAPWTLPADLGAARQEEVPQALRTRLRLELLDRRVHDPRVRTREQLAVVGLLAWGHLALDERAQALQQLARAGRVLEVHHRTSRTTLPVARRSSISCSASAARSSGKRAPTIGRTKPRVDQACELLADLDAELGAGERVGAPAGADHLDVVEQQSVDPHLGDRAAGEADHDDAPVGAQRAQAVGEALAADGVEHHVHAAAGERLGLVLPGAVGAQHVVGARRARHLLLLVAGDDRDRARAEAGGDLQRRGADPAGGPVHEHGLALPQAPTQGQREVGGVVVEDQRRALREVERVRQREGQEGGRHGDLGEGAEPAERGHAVPGAQGVRSGPRRRRARCAPRRRPRCPGRTAAAA